jgi:hypothetical protein
LLPVWHRHRPKLPWRKRQSTGIDCDFYAAGLSVDFPFSQQRRSRPERGAPKSFLMRLPVSQPAARVAANVATVGLLLAAALQLLLALGVLPITMAWGGTQPVLTLPLRIASLIAVVVLAFSTYVIRRRAGLVRKVEPSMPIKVLAWVIAGYLVLNTAGNFASASAGEATLFGPISLISALACLLVAASRTR